MVTPDNWKMLRENKRESVMNMLRTTLRAMKQ